MLGGNTLTRYYGRCETNPRNDLARYQGQNKNGTRFVMNLKSYVACH